MVHAPAKDPPFLVETCPRCGAVFGGHSRESIERARREHPCEPDAAPDS